MISQEAARKTLRGIVQQFRGVVLLTCGKPANLPRLQRLNYCAHGALLSLSWPGRTGWSTSLPFVYLHSWLGKVRTWSRLLREDPLATPARTGNQPWRKVRKTVEVKGHDSSYTSW